MHCEKHNIEKKLNSAGKWICLKCSAERTKAYRERHPEKRQEYLNKSEKERSDWAKNYYKRNQDHILERTKKYNKNNPAIRNKAQEKLKSTGGYVKRGKQNREELSRAYIVAQLRKEFGMNTEDILNNPELIELKKLQIIIYRAKVKAYRV